MSESFWPCSGCARHVKRGDATCPFCGAGNAARPSASLANAGATNEATRALAGRLSRAAILAGSVGAAVAVTSCGGSAYGAVPPPGDAGMEAATAAPGPTAQPAYGAPVPLYGGFPVRVDE